MSLSILGIVRRDQVSLGVNVPIRHAKPIADALWEYLLSNYVQIGNKFIERVTGSQTCENMQVLYGAGPGDTPHF